MNISVVIICIIFGVCCLESVNGVCYSNPDLLESGFKCRKTCVSDSDCKGPLKNCYCDGNCGMTCFNKDANCSIPKSSTNGGVQYTSIKYGSIARHFCHDGFVMVNHTTNMYNRRCRSDKNWSGIPIECKKGCPKPGKVGKRGIAEDDIQQIVGAEVKYDCGFGFYVYNGPAIRKCLNDSTWSVAKFSCEPKSCLKPKKPDNGYVNYTSYTFSSRIQFGCNEGYTLSGTTFKTCSVHYSTNEPYWRFRGSEPACTIVRCGAPEVPLNGILIDHKVDYVFGQYVTYKCKDGFDISKPARQRYYCLANKTWDTPPTCKKTYNCSFTKFESQFCGYTSRNWARIFSVDTITGKDNSNTNYVVQARSSASLTSATFPPNNKTVSISFWYKIPAQSKLSLELVKANGRSNELWSTQHKTDWKHITRSFYPQPTAVTWRFLLTSKSTTYTLLDEIVVTQTDFVLQPTPSSVIETAIPTTSVSIVTTTKESTTTVSTSTSLNSPVSTSVIMSTPHGTSIPKRTIVVAKGKLADFHTLSATKTTLIDLRVTQSITAKHKLSTSVIMSTPHVTSIPKRTILVAKGKLADFHTLSATKTTLIDLHVTQSITAKHKCHSICLCWIVAAAIFVMFCLVVICCQLQEIRKCLVRYCCRPFGSPADKQPETAEAIPLKPVVNV